jgi:hypothetical protein
MRGVGFCHVALFRVIVTLFANVPPVRCSIASHTMSVTPGATAWTLWYAL